MDPYRPTRSPSSRSAPDCADGGGLRLAWRVSGRRLRAEPAKGEARSRDLLARDYGRGPGQDQGMRQAKTSQEKWLERAKGSPQSRVMATLDKPPPRYAMLRAEHEAVMSRLARLTPDFEDKG